MRGELPPGGVLDESCSASTMSSIRILCRLASNNNSYATFSSCIITWKAGTCIGYCERGSSIGVDISARVSGSHLVRVYIRRRRHHCHRRSLVGFSLHDGIGYEFSSHPSNGQIAYFRDDFLVDTPLLGLNHLRRQVEIRWQFVLEPLVLPYFRNGYSFHGIYHEQS